MWFTWLSYDPTSAIGYAQWKSFLDGLPEHIRRELIPTGPSELWVDATKSDVVAYLDSKLDIERSEMFYKCAHLDIDESEIGKYSHFYLATKSLEIDRVVYADVTRPTCPGERCSYGSRMLSPVRIRVRSARNLGIADIGRQWGRPVELVVSGETKRLFEIHEISGLEYEKMEFYDADELSKVPFEPPYLARIERNVYAEADRIWLWTALAPDGWHCRLHSVPAILHMCNQRIPRASLGEHDFVEIGGIQVGGSRYNHLTNEFIVSRKAVEVLLAHRVKGLETWAVQGPFKTRVRVAPVEISIESYVESLIHKTGGG